MVENVMHKTETVAFYPQIELNDLKTQVVIAALNEEEGIKLTIAELKTYIGNARIIVVDGQSHDQTVAVAKDSGADIFYQDGIGKGDALAKGFKCIDYYAKYIVITDADYTYPAKYVPKMIKILEENPQVGMVCGNRFTEDVDANAFKSIFSFGNKLIAAAHSLFNGINMQDPLTGLRVIRADLLNGWHIKSSGFDIEVELNYYVSQSGFQIVEIPINYRERIGEKKLKVRDGASILKRIVLESMSNPIKLS